MGIGNNFTATISTLMFAITPFQSKLTISPYLVIKPKEFLGMKNWNKCLTANFDKVFVIRQIFVNRQQISARHNWRNNEWEERAEEIIPNHYRELKMKENTWRKMYKAWRVEWERLTYTQ